MDEFRLIVYQLSRPLSYLQIKHRDKWIYDWLVPLVLTAISLGVIYWLIPLGDVFGNDGLISDITGFIGNLPGFFIAALAAVATFNRHDIDQPMANSPKIEIMYQGHPLMIDMTRRRFLCVLFSYLTAVSIFIVIGTKIALRFKIPEAYYLSAAWTGITIYMYLLWQMLSATLLGLYYLGERLHTPQ